MSYGNGKNDSENRLVEIGSLPTTGALADLRRRLLAASRLFADETWAANPLRRTDPTVPFAARGSDGIDAVMLAVQARFSRKDKVDANKPCTAGRGKAAATGVSSEAEVCTETIFQTSNPGAEIPDRLRPKGLAPGPVVLNSKWTEKTRIRTMAALKQQVRNARRTFFGRAAHLRATRQSGGLDDGQPLNLPAPLFERLTQGEADALAAEVGSTAEAVLERARRLLEDAEPALSAAGHGRSMVVDQAEVRDAALIGHLQALGAADAALAWTLEHVRRRFGCPEFGRPDRDGDETFVAQLPLDGACLTPVRSAYKAALATLAAAAPRVLETGKPFRHRIELAGLEARGDAIPFEIVLTPTALLGVLAAESRQARMLGLDPADLARTLRFRSLTWEIGPQRTVLKAVVSRRAAVNSDVAADARKAEASAARRLARAEALVTGTPPADAEFGRGLEDLEKARAGHRRAQDKARRVEAEFRAAAAACGAVIGLDPGQREAIAFDALRLPDGVETGSAAFLDRVLDLASRDRDGMRRWFATHALPDVETLRLVNSGTDCGRNTLLPAGLAPSDCSGALSNQAFLRRMSRQGRRIDRLSTAIEANYRRARSLKERINQELGLGPRSRLPEDAAGMTAILPKTMAPVQREQILRWWRGFWYERRHALLRKAERRTAWAEINGTKKSWFGYALRPQALVAEIANRVAALALSLKAAVAIEASTWGIERNDGKGASKSRPDTEIGSKEKCWWGIERKARKGLPGAVRTQRPGVLGASVWGVSVHRLLDQVKAKLDWTGIVWWAVGSAYTSRTDVRVAVSDDRQRPKGGKQFRALWDGLVCDADIHAGTTMASAAFLRALDEAGRELRDEILSRPTPSGRPRAMVAQPVAGTLLETSAL